MRNRISKKTKDRFRRSMRNVLKGLSRSITVYLQPTKTECTNCYYDKVLKASSGICKSSPSSSNYFAVGRCPVCLGKGVLTTSRRKVIDGVVIWNPSGDSMNTATFTEIGYHSATVVEIKTNPSHLNTLKRCSYILVDGVKCKLADPPIIRGVGTQVVLIAHFFCNVKINTDSDEVLTNMR